MKSHIFRKNVERARSQAIHLLISRFKMRLFRSLALKRTLIVRQIRTHNLIYFMS